MKYPQEFVDAVKGRFPEWKDLHTALDTGSVFVGRYLDDSRVRFRPQEILEAPSAGWLMTQAQMAQRIEELYSWWFELYRQQQDKE